MEDIFPLVDRLLAAGASKKELTKTLADGCDYPQWREGLVKRGADRTVCGNPRKQTRDRESHEFRECRASIDNYRRHQDGRTASAGFL
jgi:hypothetical protein